MRKLRNTKVTVRLRKAEHRDEWFVYLESYPVEDSNKEKPQRIREYLNRSVKTVVFDKNRVARTGEKVSYKPKRDENGIIVCKSNTDQETMIFADNVRKIRQKEYDNIVLLGEDEREKLKQKEYSQQNFIQYFERLTRKRHKNDSKSIQTNWYITAKFLKMFRGDFVSFSEIDNKFSEDFKHFLLSAPYIKGRKGTLSHNTASTYFSIFKAALKQAFTEGIITTDLSAKIKGIPSKEVRREYLTMVELNKLASTPCENEILRRASLFSALTGLRLSDIQKLRWKEISIENGQAKLNFTQKKTKGVEYMPISEQALQLCGEEKTPDALVFEGLPDSSWISRPLRKWLQKSGIQKHITFHCFRHTFATLQLANGTDIYTVSKMLGHTNVNTTQVYAKVIDEKKNKAAEAIKIKL